MASQNQRNTRPVGRGGAQGARNLNSNNNIAGNVDYVSIIVHFLFLVGSVMTWHPLL